MLTPYLQQLIAHQSLNPEEMTAAMGFIMDGQVSVAQMAAFLIALQAKGETVDEIVGAARAMRARMQPVAVGQAPQPIMDTCGTGGDTSGTFNISTAAAFVLAAAGLTVAKHGNRAVSSRAGSADVLAALGVNINASVAVMQRCVEQVGVCFLFAQQLHPAMRHVAQVRRDLKIRTIFNLLGPLTNPAGATHQLVGVSSQKLNLTLAKALGQLGSRRAWVVHSRDGLDEISTGAVTDVATWQDSAVATTLIDPDQLDIAAAPRDALRGGDAAENAALMRQILSLKGKPADEHLRALHDAIALNAAAGLVIGGRTPALREGVQLARELLFSGAALQRLKDLISASHYKGDPGV